MAKPKKAITIEFSSEKARDFFAELVASNLVMVEDIRKSDRKIVDKLFKFYTNVIFRALSKALSNENANVYKRHMSLIVGTVLADMQTMIVPIVSKLRKDRLDENLILNPDDLARQCGIIDDT